MGKKQKGVFKFRSPFGCLTLIAAILSLSSILPFKEAWEIHENGKKYSRQIFNSRMVELLMSENEEESWKISGNVNGSDELLYLYNLPESLRKPVMDLDMKTGNGYPLPLVLDAWYNPEMPEKKRVLLYEKDRFSGTKKDAMIVTVFGFGPFMLALFFVSIMVIYKRFSEGNRRG